MKMTLSVRPPGIGWWALTDPAALARALPGCRSVTAGGDGTLSIVTNLSVASVQGLWSGTATYVDGDTVHIKGSGAPGTLDLVVRSNPLRTTLTVEGDVGGPLATVGASVLAAAAQRLAETLVANMAADPSVAPGAAGTPPSPAPDPGPAIRQRGPAGAAAAAVAVTGAVAVVRWRRRRRSGG
jgi:carbon monoxide dehydrogenase subunit G